MQSHLPKFYRTKDECRQIDKVISMPNPVANPQQQAQEIMKGARPQGAVANELRPPHLYYDQRNARQTFHPPARLQTSNGYIPMQNRQVAQLTQDPRRPPPPTDPAPSNSQDVRFMDGSTTPQANEVLPTQVAPTKDQSQWPSHANAITYEFKSFHEEVVLENPGLAVTTRAMRGSMPLENDVEEQEQDPLGEVPHSSDLERVARQARKAIKALKRENETLQDRPRPMLFMI